MADLKPIGGIESRILMLRGQKRFPSDFMFETNEQEAKISISQFVISRSEWGGRRRSRPYAFTEHGVAMLASVLRSEKAIEVNITIVRDFVRMREFLATHQGLAKKLAKLEQKCDSNFQVVFEAIEHLMGVEQAKRKRKIGFDRREP